MLETIASWIFKTERPLYKNDVVLNGKLFKNKILVISDQNTKKRLEGFGFCKAKTFILSDEMKHVPKEMFGHFLRGYFDGDGCLYIKQQKNKSYKARYSIVGHTPFIENLKQLLEQRFNYKIFGIYKKTENEKIKELKSGNSTFIKDVYLLMYNKATIYLTRKKNKFDLYMKGK